ncbi:MAG: hypothetical protein KAI70_03465 [Candidatus Omnitrophica bacterium]|nr:hypothetical protein [Candidatus Omnitrophota bacterium]
MAKYDVDIPKPDPADWAHTLAKVVLSAVPMIGGPAAELFGAIITPSLAKRREEWIKAIASGLKELEQKEEGFKVENLLGDESFVTILLQASQAALRDHKKEKIQCLRNATLNSALPGAPEDFWKGKYINFIETLSPWHIRMLVFLDHPYEYCKENKITATISPGGALELQKIGEQIFSDISERKWNYFNILFGDLNSLGLITKDHFNNIYHKESNFFSDDCFVSDFAKDFLKFLTSPLE